MPNVETDRYTIRPRLQLRRLAGIAGMLGLAPLAAASPQSPTGRVPDVRTTIDSLRADGSTKAVPIARPDAFNLFANVDLAAGHLRLTGLLTGGITNEGGPVSVNQTSGFVTQQIANGSAFVFFQMGFVAAAPPSVFQRIRARYPGIAGMIGSPGYTAHYWQTLAEPAVKRIVAADNQVGRVFSGVTAATDNSCRSDVRVGNIASFQLLPMKDCPVTWGSEGFLGKPAVPDSLWRERFTADKNAFRWDDWRIPRSRIDPHNLVGSQSVYGYMSDYARELKLRYGSVVPGGTGTPVEPGYPLGLELRIDAWHLGGSPARNTEFYQVQMVNRSVDVYGTGVDYDSLYFGLGPGFLLFSAPAVYVDWTNNTLYATGHNTSGRCSPVFPKGYAGTTFGPNCASMTAFTSGVYTMTWLKSPLGDLRNKLFTNAASPYYNPASPYADDTITFNHIKNNSFGQLTQNVQRSQRAAFGMISSTEQNYLDGRSPSDFTLQNYVTLFQPETWSGMLPATADARFNKFVPGRQTNPRTGQPYGTWDYNNDGVQDTIAVPMCGRSGCAGVYSDSIAGGYRTTMGNVMNTVSAGPFALRAGDTTQFLFAFAWAPDSVATRRNVELAIAAYLNNFESVRPFAFPTVSETQSYTVEPASRALAGIAGEPSVTGARITLRFPRIDAADAFAQNVIAKIRADSVAGDPATRRLLRMNPGILAKFDARARDNLADVSVFKSCDDGVTFTTTTGVVRGCAATVPTNLASPAAIPWVPLATIRYTAGAPAVSTLVDEVPAGHEYLYSFVTESRGFGEYKLVDSSTTGLFVTDAAAAFGLSTDSLRSPLLGNPGSIARVYAPISTVAGGELARVDIATVAGQATQGLQIAGVGSQARGASRVFFVNQFIVRKTVDTLSRATTTSIAARWVLPMAAVTTAPGQIVANFVAMERQFSAPLDIPVRGASGLLAPTQRSTSGSSRVFLDTLGTPAGAPGYVWVTSDNRPIYVTAARAALRQDVEQQASPLFPGFTFTVLDSADASTGFALEVTRTGVVRDRNFLLRSPTDTANGATLSAVPHVLSVVRGVGARGGTYRLTWLADPWGPGAPFALSAGAALQTTVNQSLAQAVAASSSFTDTSAFAVRQAAFGTTRTLVRARLPFSMTYTNSAGQTEPVRLAMLSRANKSQLLGNGTDTVRVLVPDSIWLPSDTLVALHHVDSDSTVSLGTPAQRVTVLRPDTVAGTLGFRPIPTVIDSVGIQRFALGCAADTALAATRPSNERASCNPVVSGTRGSSTIPFTAIAPGWQQAFHITRTFDSRSVVELTAQPTVVVNTAVEREAKGVLAVPNPYVWQSDYDVTGTGARTARLYFTGVPAAGTLRIYSVSGQFLQQLTWTQNDLVRTGSSTPAGDLPYNLKTREGLELSSGLYLFVVTAPGSGAEAALRRGKFVVIR